MSTESWKAVEFPMIEALAGSGQTYELPRQSWPRWATASTKFARLWIYCPDVRTPLSSSETTAAIVGRLLTERVDMKDAPKSYNYNFHLFTLSTGGQAYQSPPIRTSDPAHHSSAPPRWLDAYGPPRV